MYAILISNILISDPTNACNLEEDDNDIHRVSYNDLPDLTLITIGDYLEGKDFLNLAKTCKYFHMALTQTSMLFLPKDEIRLEKFLQKNSFNRIRQVASRSSPHKNRSLFESLILKYENQSENFETLSFCERMDSFVRNCRYYNLTICLNIPNMQKTYTTFKTLKCEQFSQAWTSYSNENNEKNKIILITIWEQASALDKDTRESLIKVYENGNHFLSQDEAKVRYWKSFNESMLEFVHTS